MVWALVFFVSAFVLGYVCNYLRLGHELLGTVVLPAIIKWVRGAMTSAQVKAPTGAVRTTSDTAHFRLDNFFVGVRLDGKTTYLKLPYQRLNGQYSVTAHLVRDRTELPLAVKLMEEQTFIAGLPSTLQALYPGTEDQLEVVATPTPDDGKRAVKRYQFRRDENIDLGLLTPPMMGAAD